MIYLTGDVHEKINESWEQKTIGLDDLDSAKKYLKILKEHKLKTTIFINGICLDKFPEKVKELLDYDIEFGGHTYNNFGKMGRIKGYIYRKIWGGLYGPVFYQRRDIRKTRKSFERLGLKMSSWRTHAFGSNNKTFKILAQEGVRYVSDLLGEQKPFEQNGIIHMPINIPVDQNTIAFGIFKPKNRDPFASCTKGRINSEEWFEILKRRVSENEKRGIPSVILIHPLTMNILDNFKLFDRICKFLSKYKSAKVSEFKLK